MATGKAEERTQPDIVIGIIWQGGRVLVTKRRAGVHLAGLWEFPGGKVEAGETLEAALVRELHEELGIDVVAERLRYETRHAYPERTLHLYFYDCRIREGTPRCRGAVELRWVAPEDLGELPMPEANAALVEALARRE